MQARTPNTTNLPRPQKEFQKPAEQSKPGTENGKWLLGTRKHSSNRGHNIGQRSASKEETGRKDKSRKQRRVGERPGKKE